MSEIKKRVTLKIDKEGNTTLVNVCGAGTNCQELTKGLEAALGVVDEKTREATAAAYENVDPLTLKQSSE